MRRGKAGKSGDTIKMLVSISKFVANLSEKNLTLYSMLQIRSGKLSDHYAELDQIFQVGEKIASFTCATWCAFTGSTHSLARRTQVLATH
jgi:hypothetical protein